MNVFTLFYTNGTTREINGFTLEHAGSNYTSLDISVLYDHVSFIALGTVKTKFAWNKSLNTWISTDVHIE
jgi:hypothetical protein